MNGGAGIGRYDVVYKLQELDPTPINAEPRTTCWCRCACSRDYAGSTLDRSAASSNPVPVRGLDRWLFVEADDDRVLRADHIGGRGSKLRIVALAPGFASSQVDLLGAKESPDILDIDITERRCFEWRGPAAVARGRILIQLRQNARSSRSYTSAQRLDCRFRQDLQAAFWRSERATRSPDSPARHTPAANSTIRARCRSRGSVFRESIKPSSSARSDPDKMTAVASEMPFMHPLNHEQQPLRCDYLVLALLCGPFSDRNVLAPHHHGICRCTARDVLAVPDRADGGPLCMPDLQ
jgi:hypothetical protein